MSAAALERGLTMFEMLVTVAIVVISLGAGAAVVMSAHPNERTRAQSQLLGAIDRAHALASSNGATLQIAPSGKGSVVTVLDGFAAGNVVETITTDVPIALQYSGGVIASAQLAIRRDGSWVPVVNNAQQACTGAEAIGMVGPQAAAGTGANQQPTNPSQGEASPAPLAQLGEAYALSCTDLHISVAQ